MGQYYYAVCLQKGEIVHPHRLNSGLKLMEHSWLGNEVVGTVMRLLSLENEWSKKEVVWAGDYADGIYSKQGVNVHFVASESGFKERDSGIDPMDVEEQKKNILINHTKEQYVTLNDLPGDDGWIVHPLPLLTADGNGRGGGDYHDGYPDFDKVGIWVGDKISVSTEIPEGYEKVTFNFIEKTEK